MTPTPTDTPTSTPTLTQTPTRTSTATATSTPTPTATSAASKLSFSNAAITVSENVVSGLLTVQQQDAGGSPVTVVGTARGVKLSSNSTGFVVFYESSGTTVMTGGCTSIPVGSSDVSFRYKDTTAGGPTITASGSNLGTCGGTAGTLTNATQIEMVRSAPRSVTIAGLNLLPNPANPSVAPTVQWGASTISATCNVPDPSVLTNCISKWGDKSVILLFPPRGDPGTSSTVKVNGGAASTTVDDHFYYGPVVTGLKPQGGPATGFASNTLVTINGVGFGASTTVAPVVQWGAGQTITQ